MGTTRVWRADGNGDDGGRENGGKNFRRDQPTDEEDISLDDETGPPDSVPARQSGRDPLALSLQKLQEVGLVTDLQPAREHHGEIMRVESQLAVGVDQRIRISWSVPDRYYEDGYRLLGYRRTDGFSPEVKRGELDLHGTKIIEARADGSKEEILREGEYFYTFILYRTRFFGCFDDLGDTIQFSERVPGAKYAIERLEDTYKARDLIAKLLKQAEKVRRLAGERDDKASEGLSSAENLDLMAKEQEEIDAVKRAPQWKKMTPDQRTFIIGQIRDKYRRKRESAGKR